MTAVAMSAVDADQAGMVSAVHNALRQVGQVFGVAVLGVLPTPGSRPTPPPGRPSQDRRGELFIDGLRHAIWLSGLALLATAAVGVAVLARLAPQRRESR